MRKCLLLCGFLLLATAASLPSRGAWLSGVFCDVSEPLLPNVALGDADAMQACITRYARLVWSLARRLSSGEAEAEDAVQEIYLDLWKNAGRFDATRGTELGFVAVVARRRLIDRRRAQRRLPETEPSEQADLAPPSSGDVRRVEASADFALAARALEELSDDQRDVLLLSAVQGLSHEEIASAKGMALGTVKSHARRGLLRLRALLDEKASGDDVLTDSDLVPGEPT